MRCIIIALAVLSLQLKLARSQSVDSVKRIEADRLTIEAARVNAAASDERFSASRFQLIPRASAQDMLRVIPGLMIAQHAGGGKAEQLFIRGFDADHGTDINITIDDAPVNMVSHGHGQGYADLHFLIPETIESVEAVKGPYFARHGDLTTAGAVTFHTLDSLPGNSLKVEAGKYGAYRGLAMLKGPSSSWLRSSYASAEAVSSRGYFELPQDLRRYNVFAKALCDIADEEILTVSLSSFGSTWNASGQIPERAVKSGLIGRFGAIDSTESGETSRTTAILRYNTSGPRPLEITGSYSRYSFDLTSNFTFFANDSIRGDAIRQEDRRDVIAIRAEREYASMFADAILNSTLGANVRYDNIAVGLTHDYASHETERIVEAKIQQTQGGVYTEQGLVISWFQALLGVRVDLVHFDVLNRVGGGRSTAQELIVSPKLNISSAVSRSTTLFFNSGYGFHSNDARAAILDPSTSFARALGAELGLRVQTTENTLGLSSALWMLDLQSELVYVGDEGTTQEAGPTRRMGIDLEAHAKLTNWFSLSAAATLSRGRFIELPEGANHIPLAPNLTLTTSALARYDSATFAFQLRHVGQRPANESNTVTAYGSTVCDLTARYSFGTYEVFASVENLLNAEWNEAQFDTASRMRGEDAVIGELHFTPGAPRSLRAGVLLTF